MPNAQASDLTAIMADYYKTVNLEKQKEQLAKQQKEEFICTERLGKVNAPKPKNRAPIGGYSSSSEEHHGEEENKSSSDEVYMD